MSTVTDHYDQHLGPIYSWMVGDVDRAIERNREELRALGLQPRSTGVAVDLGAGPGLHALPLAQIGFSVIAIDACAALVQELRARAGSWPIRALEGDLTQFRRSLDGPADAILCMGDTLTHLPSRPSVEALLADVAAALTPVGMFISTFRDYVSNTLEGTHRFIPVRSDEARCLTCFLEYREETVTVHDLVHERAETGWQLRVSSYPKLRLSPAWVVERLAALGLTPQQGVTPGGMVRIIARRASGEPAVAAG